jgi:ammonia channel protein AmtB
VFPASVTWYIAGYALSFGGESCLLGDIGFGYESADREGGEHGRARPLHWLTQLGFAITSSTIISGCMAERTHIAAYLAYTCFNLCFMVRGPPAPCGVATSSLPVLEAEGT